MSNLQQNCQILLLQMPQSGWHGEIDTAVSQAPRSFGCVSFFFFQYSKLLGFDTVDSIKHHKELDGKSTAIHAKIIAQDDVDVHTWPEVPDFTDPERTLLLFPGPVSFFFFIALLRLSYSDRY